VRRTPKYLATALTMLAALPATANAYVTDAEAASTVQAATVWDAVADFDAAFSPWGTDACPPDPPGTACWRYGSWTSMDYHRTSATSVWVTINHFADVVNVSPVQHWRVQWRACARENQSGSIYVTDKARVSGVTRIA
jgi:hypothetical protein